MYLIEKAKDAQKEMQKMADSSVKFLKEHAYIMLLSV